MTEVANKTGVLDTLRFDAGQAAQYRDLCDMPQDIQDRYARDSANAEAAIIELIVATERGRRVYSPSGETYEIHYSPEDAKRLTTATIAVMGELP